MSDAPPPDAPALRPPPDKGVLIVTCAILALYAFVVVAGAFGLPVTERVSSLLDTAMVLVLGYWIGSSNGSRLKDYVGGIFRR